MSAPDSIHQRMPAKKHLQELCFHILPYALLGAALLGIFWFLNGLFVGSVQTLSQISATSERVAFDVTQPRLAAFHVRAMQMGASICSSRRSNLNCERVDGLMTPSVGTRVIYGRVGYGPLSIELLPADEAAKNSTTAVLVTAPDDNYLNLIGRIYLESGGQSPHNNGSSSNPGQTDIGEPLPVWGNASIGAEFAGTQGSTPEPKLLLNGKLSLSAEAVPLFGMKPTLYRVTELDLPIGSRIEVFPSAPNGDKAKNGAVGLNWWGIVYINSDTPALTATLATNEPKLALYRPNRHEADVIEATVLTQVFSDPHLGKFYTLLVAIGGFAWLGEAIHSKWKDWRDDNAKRAEVASLLRNEKSPRPERGTRPI